MTSQLEVSTHSKIKMQLVGPIEHILNAVGLALENVLRAPYVKPVAYLA